MFITVLTYVLMVLEALCSILLIGVILLQRTKGQGMGLAFGGGMGESLFGANMGNVLTKTTVIIGIVFLLNTAALAYLGSRTKDHSIGDTIATGTPPATAPLTQPATLPPVEPLGTAGDGNAAIPGPVSIPSPAATPAPVSVPIGTPTPAEAVPPEAP